jgi:hypothetical protein
MPPIRDIGQTFSFGYPRAACLGVFIRWVGLFVALRQSRHKHHSGSCGENRSIDVYKSYRIWSALVYSQWREGQYVACQRCARAQQAADLALCLTAGWWSPWGLFITPFFAAFNIAGLVHHPDPGQPSERFRKLTRLNLARHLANLQGRATS